MELLAVFDSEDYQDTVMVLEKYTVRGIIMQDGRLATQRGKDGVYKLPGGGVEEGETYLKTLVREIREETGLHADTASVRELGEMIELRKDLYQEKQKYICHSLFYFCKVGKEREELQLTESERKRGYELSWATPKEIYERNSYAAKEPWILRDTAFVKMLLDKTIVLPE